MKRILALSLSLLLCVNVAVGCKKQAAAPAAETAPGTTQTSGNLTVFVPQGWNLVADSSNPDQVHICKGGSDLSANAYVKLTRNSALPSQSTCSNLQVLEARTYGSLSWSGFSGTKLNGNVVYLLANTGTDSILATLWYTEKSGAISLEDQDVQAILGGVSAPAAAEPAPVDPPPTADPTTIAGDWSGTLEIMDCTGDFENHNGATYSCIARFVKDEAGNITPYIGIAQEGGTITGLTATQTGEEMGLFLSGSWQGIDFSDALATLENDCLKLYISINSETSNALLSITMKQLTGTAFEEHAAQLGCTGYPTN